MISKPELSDSASFNTEAANYITGGIVSLKRKVDPHKVFERAKGIKLYDVKAKRVF